MMAGAEAAQRYADHVGRVDCHLQFGPTRVTLPRTLDGLRAQLLRLYAAFLDTFPEEIDRGVRFVLHGGAELVAGLTSDRTGPERFLPPGAGDEPRRAAELLGDGLELADALWLERKHVTWRAARTFEHVAVQLLLVHLMQSSRLADVAEERYVDTRADPLRIDRYSDDFQSLRQALVRLAQARDKIDLDLLRRQKAVMHAAALGAVTLSLLNLGDARGTVQTALDEIKDLSSAAANEAAGAHLAYLAEMRALAKDHPILVTLQHHSARLSHKGRLESYTIVDLQRDVRAAIAGAREAIAELRRIAREPVIPQPTTARPSAPPVMDLVAAVQQAARTTAWKLPFFFDRALEHLPSAERRDVLAIRRNADERAEDGALSEVLSTVGCEAIAAMAPMVGPPGIAISVAWGLICLKGSWKEYREVKTLYDASMDPATLLLGDEQHDPASPSAVILDLIGLVVI